MHIYIFYFFKNEDAYHFQTFPEVASEKIILRAQQKIASALDEVFSYPNPLADKKGKSTSSMPKHLSSQQMITYFEEKRAAKQ